MKSCSPNGSAKRAVRLCLERPAEPGPILRSQQDACSALQELKSRDRETFVALHLDNKNRIIGTEEVAIGQIAGVAVSPSDVFKSALLSNASAILVAHNHPSGDTKPSPEDEHLTTRLIDAGKLLGIRVLDHLIVGSDRCHSIREGGQISFGGYSLKRKRKKKR